GQADVECYGEIPRGSWWSEDEHGAAHGPDGRYVRATPRDLRRMPVVPMARGTGASAKLWRSHVELAGGEGLVAVRLEAQLGARGAKRKIKASESLDCTVLPGDGGAAIVAWRGLTFAVSAPGDVERSPRAAG